MGTRHKQEHLQRAFIFIFWVYKHKLFYYAQIMSRANSSPLSNKLFSAQHKRKN